MATKKGRKTARIDEALARPMERSATRHHLSPEEWLRERDGQEALRLMIELAKPPIPYATFVERMKGDGWHCEPWERNLADRLERLATEGDARIAIHKPPRHGGTTFVSEFLPPYLLGRNPRDSFGQVTHNQDHSEELSESVQRILRDETYATMFPHSQLPVQTNLREWSTTIREHEGVRDSAASFVAIGIFGSFVGKGPRTIVIDDPYGNPKDAASAQYNADVRRWHMKMLLSRLGPKSNVVVLFHRFEPDDYIGWLISEPGTTGNGKPWEVIRYSALADEVDPKTGRDFLGRTIDEPLAPTRFPYEWLANMRDSDPANFYGIYQGLPRNPGGEAVERNWFPIQGDDDRELSDGTIVHRFRPEQVIGTVLYFDIGASATGDETVGTLDSLMMDGSWSWLWQFSGQWAPAERDEKMVEICQMLKPRLNFITQLEEGIGIGRETVERIAKKLRSAGINTQVIRSRGSKWERATDRQDSFRSSAQAGRIRLYDGDWLAEIDLSLMNGRQKWIEPYLKEVTALRIKHTDKGIVLVGKDNKFDSGTGAHNGTLKLSKPSLTLGDLAVLGRRFG